MKILGAVIISRGMQQCKALGHAGGSPVKAVGLDAADIVWLHLVEGVHEVLQLALESAAHR